MAEMREPTLYGDLDTSVPEIRLFALLPSPQPNAPVVGQLQIVPLQSPPPYESLSYAWGAPEFTEPIIVNEQTLFVTPNLDSALRALRHEEKLRLLWIDAICINQRSPQERGHQVTLMRTIYSQCERDLLWLGPNTHVEQTHYMNPSEDLLGEGMQLMRGIADKDISVLGVMGHKWTAYKRNRIERFLRILKRQQSEKDVPDAELAAKIKQREAELSGAANDSAWLLSYDEQTALERVLTFPTVWNRLWVMQELSLAPKIQLVGGRYTLDWDIISGFLGDTPYADAFHGTYSHNSVQPCVGRIFEIVQKIDHQRRIMKEVSAEHRESKLMDVLARFRDTESSDPRDKIFGLLGLVSGKVNIEISYELTTHQVFASVTAAIINESGNLDIICQRPWTSNTGFVSFTDGQESSTGQDKLPSWAADFSTGGQIHLFAQRSIFQAGRSSCKVPCHMMNGSVLQTKGTVLGPIGPILQQDSVGPPQQGADSTWIPLEWLKLYLGCDVLSSSESDHSYVTGEPAFTAFWRTLVVDCVAYPMTRLTKNQVEEEDSAIRARWLQKLTEPSGPETKPSHDDEPFISPGIHAMWRRITSDWVFSITTNGLYVLIMPPAKEGDIIACLDGGKVPVVLRPLEDTSGGEEKRYQFISVAYVHGLMDFGTEDSTILREKLGLEDQGFWLV
ncbi:unnamed protein product [Clonostachys rosea f. rosea IK726]|uniref:Heterokaryon incompatibility domain-containing protein n=2 Tax=Bionectria ochroleuca TaxID=29856 RepID=A0A0B7KAU2_BIOOC|nr:unnamed protein product [Clonostachys rosea f. rosea IK726]